MGSGTGKEGIEDARMVPHCHTLGVFTVFCWHWAKQLLFTFGIRLAPWHVPHAAAARYAHLFPSRPSGWLAGWLAAHGYGDSGRVGRGRKRGCEVSIYSPLPPPCPTSIPLFCLFASPLNSLCYLFACFQFVFMFFFISLSFC